MVSGRVVRILMFVLGISLVAPVTIKWWQTGIPQMMLEFWRQNVMLVLLGWVGVFLVYLSVLLRQEW